MEYSATQNGEEIVITRKENLLNIISEVCRINNNEGVIIFTRESLFRTNQETIKCSDIKRIIGRSVSGSVDKGAYIGYGVVIITEDFEYLVDIYGESADEARVLITLLKENIK